MAEARDAVRARDGAAAAAGRVFVDASAAPGVPSGGACGAVPALALVTLENQQLLDDAGEGTLGTTYTGQREVLEGMSRCVNNLKELEPNCTRSRINTASGPG